MVAGCVCVLGGWGVGLFLTCSVLVTLSFYSCSVFVLTICWFCYGGFNSVLIPVQRLCVGSDSGSKSVVLKVCVFPQRGQSITVHHHEWGCRGSNGIRPEAVKQPYGAK